MWGVADTVRAGIKDAHRRGPGYTSGGSARAVGAGGQGRLGLPGAWLQRGRAQRSAAACSMAGRERSCVPAEAAMAAIPAASHAPPRRSASRWVWTWMGREVGSGTPSCNQRSWPAQAAASDRLGGLCARPLILVRTPTIFSPCMPLCTTNIRHQCEPAHALAGHRAVFSVCAEAGGRLCSLFQLTAHPCIFSCRPGLNLGAPCTSHPGTRR